MTEKTPVRRPLTATTMDHASHDTILDDLAALAADGVAELIASPIGARGWTTLKHGRGPGRRGGRSA